MYRHFFAICTAILFWILAVPYPAGAVDVAPRISDREIIESLTELRQGQKGLEQRLQQVQTSLERQIQQSHENLSRRMDDMMVNFNKRFEAIDKRFESIDKRFESIDKRFESIDNHFDSLTNLIVALFGSVMALIVALVGYMIWDRQTAQKPLREKITGLEVRSVRVENQLEMTHPSGSLLDRLLAAFRELAKTDPKVADVLKSFALL